MAVLTEKKVLGLQVPIDNSILMKVPQRQDHLSRIEQDILLTEPSLLLKMVKQAATAFVVKHKVKLGAALKRVVELQDERMAQLAQQLLLQLNVVEEVLLLQVTFVEHFHGEES